MHVLFIYQHYFPSRFTLLNLEFCDVNFMICETTSRDFPLPAVRYSPLEVFYICFSQLVDPFSQGIPSYFRPLLEKNFWASSAPRPEGTLHARKVKNAPQYHSVS